ncbi:MAG: hypothetical protein IT385_29950 [Deltaproteobacteria bacterium]|nr:hypothetical protein [Deltaproteobacteria bacterium]
MIEHIHSVAEAGVGYGYGNRADDLDQNGTPAKNKTIDSGAFGGIPEPELDELKAIHKQEVAGPAGTYRGYEVAGGQTLTTDVGADVGHKPGKGDAGYEVEGVDAPIDLGVGVSASARAYAKAGAGAGAHLSGALGRFSKFVGL